MNKYPLKSEFWQDIQKHREIHRSLGFYDESYAAYIDAYVIFMHE